MYRVLVVDDRESELALMRLLVERLGYTFYGEADGKRFLDLVYEVDPHLIVLDLLLPMNISGIDLARLARQDAQLSAIPILAMTAAPEKYPESVALAAGCNAYLRKPFGVEVWEAVVYQLLQGGNS